MQIEIEKMYNAYWPPKYDLICMGSQCRVLYEFKFGQEFYESQIDCKLRLCPICKFQEKKCTVPNCQISIKDHNLKTNFNIQTKKVFSDLDREVQEQLNVRKRIEERYHRQISDIKQSYKPQAKLDKLSEYIEDAIYAERSNNQKLMLEIDKSIQILWRQIETEEENNQQRELPKQIQTQINQGAQLNSMSSQISYAKEAGFNEKQFHINRIQWGL